MTPTRLTVSCCALGAALVCLAAPARAADADAGSDAAPAEESHADTDITPPALPWEDPAKTPPQPELAQSYPIDESTPPAPPPVVPVRLPEPAGRSRVLLGHLFQYPLLVDSALMGTTFALDSGLIYQRVPSFPAGSLGATDVTQMLASTQASFQLMIFDRLALFGQASGLVQTGDNLSSLFASGVQYQDDLTGGVLVNLVRSQLTGSQLTLRGQVGSAQGRLLGIEQLVNQINTTPGQSIDAVVSGATGQSLLTPFSTLHYGGGLAFAQAFGCAFSLQLSANLIEARTSLQPLQSGTGVRETQTQNALTPSVAAALTLGGADAGFPFALMAEYRLEETFLGALAETPEQDGALGIYYSGRPDMQLGLAALASQLPPLVGQNAQGGTQRSSPPATVGGDFVFRYVW